MGLSALDLLPLLVPPLAYGIPLASLPQHLGGALRCVIIINMVPIVPFVIVILMHFGE